MSPLLQAEQLVYAYPGSAPVVRDVSFAVPTASLTAVIGANGSGKSTLIRMLAGLLRPASGRVLLNGSDLRTLHPRMRARQLAYVPQTTVAAFPFSVLDVVLSGRTPHIAEFRLESAQDRDRALHALESAGAAHLANRSFTALSGGERQMVVLARALAQEPRLLLLDEPSSSLDLKHRAELMRTLARLRAEQNLSAIMITHDLQLTGRLFDHIVAIRCGEVLVQGRPDEVLTTRCLSEIYDEPNVRAQQMGNQILVWLES